MTLCSTAALRCWAHQKHRQRDLLGLVEQLLRWLLVALMTGGLKRCWYLMIQRGHTSFHRVYS